MVGIMTRSIRNILDSAYRHELNPDVKARILLVRHVRASVVKDELHRSKAWAYKCLKRFNWIKGLTTAWEELLR
jgi:hypothetical protein